MSAYDDAVAYLDAEVHPRCDYDIYSDMRDIVDEMEAENAKLRELVNTLWSDIMAFDATPYYKVRPSDDADGIEADEDWAWKDERMRVMRESGIEVRDD